MNAIYAEYYRFTSFYFIAILWLWQESINSRPDGLPTTLSKWENPRNNCPYLEDKFKLLMVLIIYKPHRPKYKQGVPCEYTAISSSVILAAGSETSLAAISEEERLYSQANKEAHTYYSAQNFKKVNIRT